MITPLVAYLAVAPANDGQWTAATTTATAVAQRVDANLATMRNTKVKYQFFYKRGEENGYMTCESTVIGPGVYWMQVPEVNAKRMPNMVRERWISNGKRFGKSVEPDGPRPGPLTKRPSPYASPAAAWFTNFSRTIMLGIAAGSRPFQSLLADAGRQGYKSAFQQRQFTRGGTKTTQYRTVLTKGPARYEIVVDGRFMLPVSIVNYANANDNTRWSGVSWQHSRKPMDASIATFRPPAKTTILSQAPRPR